MSKTTLNLSIAEPIKRRAKRIAKQRGMSVSRFFEELIASQDDPEEWSPPKGSAVERLMNIIPESDKLENPDYDKMRYEGLKEKYDLD
jgi:antitoxin component of RelBE/YafQ-DinJ toxin-antitoxin module